MGYNSPQMMQQSQPAATTTTTCTNNPITIPINTIVIPACLDITTNIVSILGKESSNVLNSSNGFTAHTIIT
jgi:hypothetical protein